MRVRDMAGTMRDIEYGDVKTLQGFIGVVPLQAGGVPIAGGRRDYVVLETKHGRYEIPRSAENDPEILTFLLSKDGSAAI